MDWFHDKRLNVLVYPLLQAFPAYALPDAKVVSREHIGMPFTLQNDLIDTERKNLPELPEARKARFIGTLGLSGYDAEVLTQDKKTADYFEECVKFYNKPKIISNWLMGDVSGYLNAKNLSVRDSKLKPQGLAGLLKEVDSGKISGKMAKDIIIEMLDTGKDAAAIISEKGLAQISDTGELEKFAEEAIAENAKTAEDFLKGKDNALMFLVGQVMKKTKGKANPAVVNKILKDKLSKKR